MFLVDATDSGRSRHAQFWEGREGEGWRKGDRPYWTRMVDAGHKGNGIIRVSAIANLLDVARNPYTVSLLTYGEQPRPASVYKEIYLWLYWTRPIVDAAQRYYSLSP